MQWCNKKHKKPAYYQYCYTKTENKHWLEYAIFVFAVVAALATSFAACYTKRQWETASDQERRSLRAYVFADTADITVSPTDANAVIHMKNSGQTPAYDFIFWVQSKGMAANLAFEQDHKTDYEQGAMNIGPSSSVTLTSYLDIPQVNLKCTRVLSTNVLLFTFGERQSTKILSIDTGA